MTSINIPGIHGWVNQYYLLLSNSFGLSQCHGGELGSLCQLPVHSTARQYGTGDRQIYAFEAVLRVPSSVLQDAAVRLKVVLLQQADPVFFPELINSAYGGCVPESCWHTTGVMLGKLFFLLTSRQRGYFCSLRLETSGLHSERDITR